jgi:hypothetical protein
MRVVDRRRHQHVRLTAGVAEHNPLITRPFVFVADRVNSHRDVGRLRVDVRDDLGVFPVKAALFVADFTHDMAGDVLESIMGHGRGPTNFAGHHDEVGRAERFHSDPRMRVLGQKSVENRI